MDCTRASLTDSPQFYLSLPRNNPPLPGTGPPTEIFETANIDAIRKNSIVESSESTLCGCFPSHGKNNGEGEDMDVELDTEDTVHDPLVRKLKARIANFLHTLNCRRGTGDIFDDASRDMVQVQAPHNNEEFPVMAHIQCTKNEEISNSTATDTVRFTKNYDNGDDKNGNKYIYTQTIIRPRGGAHGLNCIRNTNALEDDGDASRVVEEMCERAGF